MSCLHKTQIAIVTSILHPKYGGPAAVIDALEKHLSADFDVSIWSRIGQNEDVLYSRYPGGHFFHARVPHRWFYCKGLYKALLNAQPKPDIIHAHMLWDYSTFAAWRVSKKRGIPLVVTPHGTLNEAWRQNGLHKRLYNQIVLRKILADISCIHALNEQEKQALISYGAKCPIEIIPNGIDTPTLSIPRNTTAAECIYPGLKGKKRILFMGRLWPEKGVDLLVKSWASLHEFHKDWILILAGPDYRGYKSTLVNTISRTSLEKTILLPGMVEGTTKEALFAGSDVFVLPSYSEGFSMAILEALAYGLAIVYSKPCNASWVSRAGAGIETECSSEELVKALKIVLKLSDKERSSMGQQGRSEVSRHYTWDIIANSFKNLYESLLRH
jgi:glycosyltransferase involved in cell wall biosynthesis